MVPIDDIDESDRRMLARLSLSPNYVAPAPAPAPAPTPAPVANLRASVPAVQLVSSVNPSPASVSPTPVTPVTAAVVKVQTPPVKTATPDIVLFDDSTVPVEIMSDLIFENIGGQELINISRNDLINGVNVQYQPISNLVSLNQQYKPDNILNMQNTSNKYFAGYAIKFEEKVPKVGTSVNPVYFDDLGNLVVESVNLNSDEQIEIEIAVNGTIYETEI